METGPVDGPWDLPEGWRWEPLGRYSADRSESINPARWPDRLFELYSVPSFDSRRPEVIAGKEIGSSKQTVQPGDVLLCKINPRINRAWVVGPATSHEQIASTEWIRFPCATDVVPEFLRHYFSMEALRSYLALNASGVGGSLMRVKAATLASYPVPVPPLDTQRRIVARIDELFSELDDGEAALARARADLETYRKSLLKAAVTGELTADWRAANPPAETGEQLLQRILADRKARWEADEAVKGRTYKLPAGPDLTHCPDLPNGWTWCSLDQLCYHVTSGSRAWSPYYGRGQSVFIMAQNVRAGFFDGGFVQLVDPPENDPERRRTRVRRGDLLLTIVGANTGDLCRINFEPEDHYVCQSVALLRPVADWIGELCEFFFAGSFGRKLQMEKLIYGAGRPHLSFDQIRSLAVPIPPVAEAGKVIEEVRAIRDEVADLSQRLQAPSAAPEQLRQSVLAAAFRGELVQ